MEMRKQSSFRSVPHTHSSSSGLRFDELYTLGKVLGRGAFSVVRSGKHRTRSSSPPSTSTSSSSTSPSTSSSSSPPSIEYAIKIIDRTKLKEQDVLALRDEVAILTSLRECEHVIRLYDYFDEPPHRSYLVLEVMAGGELFDRIVSKSYYNEREARDTCRTLLEAVHYCHRRRVAHRDLKPENLLLTSASDDSGVKIADFGFAKVVGSPRSLRTQCGTPGYVAPEIIAGDMYDESADMWSVGVILYILLGGYPPFVHDNQRKLFRKIRRGKYEFHADYWSTVSSDAKDLISGLLRVDAGDRLTADGALRSEWIAVADDRALERNDMGSNLIQLRKFNGRRKFRAAVASVIAVNKLQNFLAFDNFVPWPEK